MSCVEVTSELRPILGLRLFFWNYFVTRTIHISKKLNFLTGENELLRSKKPAKSDNYEPYNTSENNSATHSTVILKAKLPNRNELLEVTKEQ